MPDRSNQVVSLTPASPQGDPVPVALGCPICQETVFYVMVRRDGERPVVAELDCASCKTSAVSIPVENGMLGANLLFRGWDW